MDPRSPSSPRQVDRLTTKSGHRVGDKYNSLLVGPRGPNLLADVPYIEETAHFNRERIPERVVHAKGAAAYGKFVVTDTSISQFTKASLFQTKGKQTAVACRFSHVTGESGIADTARDVRGFAVKFYSEEGNWDLVGNNLPVFFIRDPINFASFIHSQKRNPKTHLRDPDAFWDFISLVPETLHTTTMLFSDRGVPDGFRHMHGFGVNTFKLVNAQDKIFYAKFHWICGQKVRCLEQALANQIAGSDPDYCLRDLFNSIENGAFPNWTLKAQVMTPEHAERLLFNPFDATKIWPHADFPLIEVGKMTLDKNVYNYFAQTEQLAYSPSNLIPGIEASLDKLLVGRILSYPDAQRYRLGANFADIPCNQARCPVMTPTYCDGVTFMSNWHGGLPNYVPSIQYEHLKVDPKHVEHKQHFSGAQGRYDLSQDDNYSQVRALLKRVLSKTARGKLAKNMAEHLGQVKRKEIVDRVLVHYKEIDSEFHGLLERALGRRVEPSNTL